MIFIYILIGAFLLLLIGRIQENSKVQKERKEDVQANSFRYAQRQEPAQQPTSYNQATLIEDEKKMEEKSTPKNAKKTAKERRIERLKEQAKEIFSDNPPSVKDYSHLTPEEAERKLERLKDEEGWVEDDVYKGLIRIINDDYPVMEIPEDVLNGTPQDMEKWFLGTHDSFGFSKDVFKTISTVLKPYHEPNLLKEIDDVSVEELEDWMNKKKRQGIFFSNKVYSKMRRKWLSQYNL